MSIISENSSKKVIIRIFKGIWFFNCCETIWCALCDHQVIFFFSWGFSQLKIIHKLSLWILFLLFWFQVIVKRPCLYRAINSIIWDIIVLKLGNWNFYCGFYVNWWFLQQRYHSYGRSFYFQKENVSHCLSDLEHKV